MAQQQSPPIPLFYRISFIAIDPLIAAWGAYMDIFTPAFAIAAFAPPNIVPYNPFYNFLQHQLAGALLLCVIIDLFLLRKTRELWVWDPVQSGQLVWDVIMAVSQVYSWEQQGRLSVKKLRWEDWGALAITGVIGLVRVAFLMRVGFGKGVGGKKERRM